MDSQYSVTNEDSGHRYCLASSRFGILSLEQVDTGQLVGQRSMCMPDSGKVVETGLSYPGTLKVDPCHEKLSMLRDKGTFSSVSLEPRTSCG